MRWLRFQVTEIQWAKIWFFFLSLLHTSAHISFIVCVWQKFGSGLMETVHTFCSTPEIDVRLFYLSDCFIDYIDNNIESQMLLMIKWNTIISTVCHREKKNGLPSILISATVRQRHMFHTWNALLLCHYIDYRLFSNIFQLTQRQPPTTLLNFFTFESDRTTFTFYNRKIVSWIATFINVLDKHNEFTQPIQNK